MSASLVGSEMCIRDSTRAAREEPSASRATAKQVASPRPATSKVRKRLTPVSYTHLTLPTICSV
eukprot:10763419-Alexandrium_andersonii.AAC.1